MNEKLRQFFQKIITFTCSYIELCLWLLVFAIGIRFFEAIFLNLTKGNFASILVCNLQGLCYDVSLHLRTGGWIFLIFVAGSFLSEKKSRIILRIFLSLMLLVSLICIVFFTTSGFLLDKIIFSYSLKEIWGILNASAKSPVWVYIIVVVLPILYFIVSAKRIKIKYIISIAFIALTISSFFIFNEVPLGTDQYHIKVNKEYFFLKSVIKTTSTFKESDETMVEAVKEFQSYFPEHKFVGTEYPFLYQAVHKDVLSPFFELKPEPPNLVFIIVEGLGYDFLKNDYQLMPFLDSLSKESLSWEYCLSSSARTFGVLPALFGTSPLGEKGFLDQCPNNPEYYSLLRILHQNNYTNNFFYGGQLFFDNMVHFFDRNNTIYLDNNDWEHDLTKQKTGNEWGYDDHIVYLQALRKLNRVKSSPRADIYLSLSTHDPWEYPRSSYFQSIVKNKVFQNKTLSNQQKKSILNRLKVYAGFSYSDWSLQQLFEGYKKRNDFDNTIFVITGDHNAFATQFGGYSNYHVPLIIYSPMLKYGKNMKGVVSHRDITPTILSFLHHNYHIKTPEEVAWLNTALDTSSSFKSNTFTPLQLINHTIGGIVYKNYMLCEGIVEKFTENNVPRKINNPNIVHRMDHLLSLYKTLDSYILRNESLIKNCYAHNTTLTNVIIDVEDTIAPGSYFAQNSNLPVVEGPDNHKTTLYFDSSNIFPIGFLSLDIPNDNIERFKVEIEFKIYIINKNKDRLEVVRDLLKNEEHELYVTDFLTADVQNRWYTYKYATTFKKETYPSTGKGSRYTIYIWNKNKLKGFIDDIKVRCTMGQAMPSRNK